MMKLLRKRARRGACLGLGCYTLFLLLLVWTVGENQFTKQLRDLDAPPTHHHQQPENSSRQKKKMKDSTPGDTLFQAGGPWKFPARRKLSRPDAQQVNVVVVEDALPGTFRKKSSSWPETAGHFQDLRQEIRPDHPEKRVLNGSRVTDPRSLDRILAGSPPVETETQSEEDPQDDGDDWDKEKDRFPEEKEDKVVQELPEGKENEVVHSAGPDTDSSKENSARHLGMWIAPDGAVESQTETEADTPAQPPPPPPPSPSSHNSSSSIHTNSQHPHHQDTQHPRRGNKPSPPKPQPTTTTTTTTTTTSSSKHIPFQKLPHIQQTGSQRKVNHRAANFVEISDMTIYSAFYDARLRGRGRRSAGPPLVRMLAMGPVSRRPPVGYLWCVFASASAEPVAVILQQTVDCERMRKYCFYMLHCRIPERILKTNATVTNVLLLSSRQHDDSSNLFRSPSGERVRLNVINNTNHVTADVTSVSRGTTTTTTTTQSSSSSSLPPPRQRQPSFSVCVPPLFGKITVLQIVEFVELNRLLGASHVVFYTFRVSREVSRVLSFYEEAGVVTVMPWNIPAPNDVWNKGESIAMGDCLYRNMQIFDYVFFSNINEFWVPKRATSWQKLIEKLNSQSKTTNTKTAAYELLPVKMYPNETSTSFSPKKAESSKFLTLRNTLRGQPFGANLTKVVVKPENVLEVHSEFCVRSVSEDFKTQKVDFEEAVVYQFTPKLCSLFRSEKKVGVGVGSAVVGPNCNELYEDHTFWRYKDSLLTRAKDVVKALNRQADTHRLK